MTYEDPLPTLFDLATEDPAVWQERLALLRRSYGERDAIRAAYVNDLRFGGPANVDILTSALADPRAAFLAEWDRKIHHRALWERFGCDPAYDPRRVADIRAFERLHKVAVPPSLVDFVARRHSDRLVFHWQPTNNDLVPPAKWVLRRAPGGWHVLRTINENQGCCYWFVAWRDDLGALDPPVFVGDDDDRTDNLKSFFRKNRCTANHWSEFLYDYAREGEKWYEAHPSYRVDYRKFDRDAPGQPA